MTKLPSLRAAAAALVLGVLAGCGSFAIQEDAAARIEAALQRHAWTLRAADPSLESVELTGVSLQIFGTGAQQSGTYRERTRRPDGTVAEKTGTFDADWERQPDGSWSLVTLTKDPPPYRHTTEGETP